MFNINKSLSNYIEMHKEQDIVEPESEELLENKNIVREKVDIYEMCAEIDGCLNRVTDIVKKDLARIASLDTKLHH
jgi:hypothetical protein